MAGPNDERDPFQSRADAINEGARRPAGDPRITGRVGSRDRPWHVVIDSASREFFDSFRAPTAAQGPQRPEETRTGEQMFRASIADQRVAAQLAKETSTQLKTAAAMAVQFTGDMGRFTAALRQQQEVERQRISDVLDRIDRTVSGGGGGGGSGPPRGPGGGGTGAGAPPPSGGGSGRPSGPGPGTRAKPDLGYEKLSTHQAHALRAHHGGIRRQVMGQLGEGIHQTLGMGTDETNTVVPVRDKLGQVTHYEERGPDGVVHDSVAVDDPRAAGMAKKAMHAMTASRIAGAVAAQTGIGGAVKAGAGGILESIGGAGGVAGGIGTAATLGARAIPIVGGVVMAGELVGKGLRYAQEQRAKNAFYQSTLGQSNEAGFGDRIAEEGFTYGEMFRTGYGDDQARQLFKGVTAMGMQGNVRDRATSFASQNYRSMGMSVDQNLKAVQIASSQANVSLAGVSRALQEVTKSATMTGQSADVMREKFLGVMQAAGGAGLGASAPAVAQILTQAGPGRGRDEANVDFSGMFNEMNMRMIAGQSGLSYPQMIGQNMSGNYMPMLAGQDKLVSGAIKGQLGGRGRAELDRLIQENGGVEAVRKDPNLRRTIATQLEQSGVGPDPSNLTRVLDQYGVTGVDAPDQAAVFAVDEYTGGNALVTRAQNYQKDNNERDMTAEEQDRGLLGIQQSEFVKNSYASDWDWMISSQARSKDDVVQAYENLQDDTKKTDPAIEKMIETIGGNSGAALEVQTGDGKKVVSQSDAIKYYADQIATGEAVVVGGQDNNRKISDVTGSKESNFAGPTSTDKAFQGDEIDKKKWLEDNPGVSSADNGGKFTLELAPDAQRLVRLMGGPSTTNPQVEAGARSAVPPAITGSPPR